MSDAHCPRCGAALPPVREAYCPSCRAELPESPAVPNTRPEEETPPDGAAAAPPDPRAEAFRQFHGDLRLLTPRTPVTPILVAANVIVFAIMVASGVHVLNPSPETLLAWGANRGPVTVAGEWWRLVTAEFVHIGLFHLALNMLCLVGVGLTVERLVGSVGFLLLYLSSAVVASLVSIAWSPLVVSAGASGAIFGVFGAFFGASFRTGDTVPKLAAEASRRGMAKFVAINLLLGLGIPNIDMAAHVGGMAWGFACGLMLGHPIRADAASRRAARNVVLVAMSALAIAPGVAVARSRVANTIDPAGEMARIVEIEDRVLTAYNDAVLRNQAGTLDDAGFLLVLENDVLPPWRDARQRFQRIRNDAYFDRRMPPLFTEYLNAREDGWELLCRAIREDNPALETQAWKRMEDADRIVATLEATFQKKP